MSADEPTPAAEGGTSDTGAEGGTSDTDAEGGTSDPRRVTRRNLALQRARELAAEHLPRISRAKAPEPVVGGPALASAAARSAALFVGIAFVNGLQGRRAE